MVAGPAGHLFELDIGRIPTLTPEWRAKMRRSISVMITHPTLAITNQGPRKRASDAPDVGAWDCVSSCADPYCAFIVFIRSFSGIFSTACSPLSINGEIKGLLRNFAERPKRPVTLSRSLLRLAALLHVRAILL